jgi:hypothetical protein
MQKPASWAARLMVLERAPGCRVAVPFSGEREKLVRRERSMIHPPEEMVDQGLFPPDLMTNGIFDLIAV